MQVDCVPLWAVLPWPGGPRAKCCSPDSTFSLKTQPGLLYTRSVPSGPQGRDEGLAPAAHGSPRSDSKQPSASWPPGASRPQWGWDPVPVAERQGTLTSGVAVLVSKPSQTSTVRVSPTLRSSCTASPCVRPSRLCWFTSSSRSPTRRRPSRPAAPVGLTCGETTALRTSPGAGPLPAQEAHRAGR